MIVSFDLDGVLFHSPELIEDVIQTRFDVDGPLWQCYNIEETDHPATLKRAVISCFKDPKLMVGKMKIDMEDLDVLDRLATYEGNTIYIVSSRRMHRNETIEKLHKIIPPYLLSGILFCDGRGMKYQVLNGIQAHYHIDDDVEECLTIQAKTKTVPILLEKPYNLEERTGEDLLSFPSLHEIYRHITR